jgi:hypothetical protein
MKASINIPVALIIVLLSVVVTYQAVGHRAQMEPPIVATVDLVAVMEGLNERADAEAELRAIADEIRAEQVVFEQGLEETNAQLENATNPDERADLEEQLALQTLEYQGWVRFASDKLDVEKALLLQNLYRITKQSIESMAEAEGFAMVLIDDSLGELTVNPEAKVSREAQVRQQIAGRRFLYAQRTLDVTDDLIARMNNAYNAGAP